MAFLPHHAFPQGLYLVFRKSFLKKAWTSEWKKLDFGQFLLFLSCFHG